MAPMVDRPAKVSTPPNAEVLNSHHMGLRGHLHLGCQRFQAAEWAEKQSIKSDDEGLESGNGRIGHPSVTAPGPRSQANLPRKGLLAQPLHRARPGD